MHKAHKARTMTKKAAWLYEQSGVVPYFREAGELKLVLITSKSGAWGIPKGAIEPSLTAARSAAKEALEEAGVEGVCSGEAFTTYDYNKWQGVCTVQVFGLYVTKIYDEWDESYKRRRKICTPVRSLEMVKPAVVPVLHAFFEYERAIQ